MTPPTAIIIKPTTTHTTMRNRRRRGGIGGYTTVHALGGAYANHGAKTIQMSPIATTMAPSLILFSMPSIVAEGAAQSEFEFTAKVCLAAAENRSGCPSCEIR